MEKNYKYMVVTRCITYNHAPYIVDAMNGFTMQETSFPVITLIVDDASTDGEPEVIRDYLTQHFHEPYRTEETDDYQLICANHKTNPNCTFVVFFLKYNHYSIKKTKFPYLSEWLDNAKYHALCEGDDYWIHPGKLQIQVDFMECNSKFSLCFHDANTISLYINQSIDKFHLPIYNRQYSAKHLFSKGWFIPTASLLYKASCLPKQDSFPEWTKYPGLGGDIVYQMFLAAKGPFYYIAEKMSVYRFGTPGSATERSKKYGNYGAYKTYLQFLKNANLQLYGNQYSLWIKYRYVKLYVRQILNNFINLIQHI